MKLVLASSNAGKLVELHDLLGDAGIELHAQSGFGVGDAEGRRRVLVHASGFRQSPYADTKPAGESGKVPAKLWHASPGSAG